MILCACLFVPWGQRRSGFVPRLAAGVCVFLALTDTLTFLPLWAKLLLYTTLLFGLIWFSFDCSPLHALFYTTCAYAVQHIASKLACMPIIWLIQHDRTDRLVNFVILLFSNLVVCLVIYLLFTLRIRRGRLLFDNVKTVLYSGFFLIAAVYLSVVLEDVLDSSAESYLTAYLALNAFCILFAITILALEFSNCSIKSLEHENEMLAQLLECDTQQYEQAKKDMEKINIRYHDLKQQYSRATDEERARLEEEMDNLNLRYLTGNKALDITLTQKSALCGQAGIQLVCSADGSCLENMKHYHIYSLLGNALDNAIECLTQVNDASKRVITLDISRCRDMAGIRVFATGGIGGVHRGAQETFDISADLEELANTSVMVVCAGAKSILDLGLTLEYLETHGVTVIGYGTSELPAFYTRKSGFGVDYELDTPEQLAKAFHVKRELGLRGGLLVTNPIPEEYSMDKEVIDKAIAEAVEDAKKDGIHGKATTPYLLAKIKDLTGGDSLDSNIQLVFNNARLGAAAAVELNKLEK